MNSAGTWKDDTREWEKTRKTENRSRNHERFQNNYRATRRDTRKTTKEALEEFEKRYTGIGQLFDGKNYKKEKRQRDTGRS